MKLVTTVCICMLIGTTLYAQEIKGTTFRPTSSIVSTEGNLKTAFPRGVGDEHFIEAHDRIDYKITFQNHTADYVNRIVILDTLSEYLTPQSLQPGTSSHDYEIDIIDGHILQFSFYDIFLASSSDDEENSHGYVSYSIGQKTNNPIGTVIYNTAWIYMDNALPISTNTTFHTVGKDFVETKAMEVGLRVAQVYPNPVQDIATVQLTNLPSFEAGAVFVFDISARLVHITDFHNHELEVELRALSPGLYCFHIYLDEKKYAVGRFLVMQ